MSDKTGHLSTIISEAVAAPMQSLLRYRQSALATALAKAWVREEIAAAAAEVSIHKEIVNQKTSDRGKA